jgi:ABC-type sugar transport system ATPase subunit
VAATAVTASTKPAQSPTQPAEPVLEVRRVSKSFGPTRALRSCSVSLLRGEIHALLGENGSGKSTLVKILSGVHQPDDGELIIGGRPAKTLGSPHEALSCGIATVFQEVLVAGSRSVLDNVWLGSDGVFRSRISRAEKRERAQQVLTALLGEAPPLDAPVEALALPVRQACAIARALLRAPAVLLLDEATSTLDVAIRDRLFAVLRDLASNGTTVLFISHRMEEINEIADRVTVMRSGEVVATQQRGEATVAELVRLMTGADALVEQERGRNREPGEVAIAVRGLMLAPGRPAIDLQIRRGELVGLAGLEGHGQELMLAALAGSPAYAGEVICEGTALDTPAKAAARGVALVPRERRSEGLFESKSILENFGLPTLARDRRAIFISDARTRARLAQMVSSLRIQLSDPAAAVTTLSGGNQQKVIMARWLATEPRVLLLNDPTRGIDLGAKRDLYGVLQDLAEQDVAVVMLSSELDEHIELMDRVLVFREHSLEREFTREQLDRQAVLSAFFGAGGQ